MSIQLFKPNYRDWDDETTLFFDNKQVQVPIIQNHVGFIRNPTLKVRVRV